MGEGRTVLYMGASVGIGMEVSVVEGIQEGMGVLAPICMGSECEGGRKT